MSDGPYRSLPMPRMWKRAAERAYFSSFSISEISDALQQAAERDCRAELSPSLVSRVTALIMGTDEPGLFSDLPTTDLNALHRDCSSTMEHGLVNNAVDALQNGFRGRAALQRAAETSVSERLLAGSRQIEEHMHRQAYDYLARATRSRLEEAYRGVDVSGVARLLLRSADAPVPTRTVVYSGIDDGVSF